MIQLIGIRNNVEVEIREKLTITNGELQESLKSLLDICDEACIISTCNRTEIYFNCKENNSKIIEKIFEKLNWKSEFIKYTFHLKDKQVPKHLMEVSCGFHSKIFGEDQILGQVKKAYDISLKNSCVRSELQRLFQFAITCGKEFKNKSKLYKVPVSVPSIAVKESEKYGINNYMILGYGEMGKLTTKYILERKNTNVYIAVRNINSVYINDSRIKVIPFEERKKFYKNVECIISCTSAPNTVIQKKNLENAKLKIFDLAIPRDVDEEVSKMENIQVYNIDRICALNDKNQEKRKEIMMNNKHIVSKYLKEFEEWVNLREITPQIKNLLEHGENVYKTRQKTFTNKKNTKDNDKLVERLLKSTSDAYVNRAIEVLKEEKLNGRAEECLRIIEKIFCIQN